MPELGPSLRSLTELPSFEICPLFIAFLEEGNQPGKKEKIRLLFFGARNRSGMISGAVASRKRWSPGLKKMGVVSRPGRTPHRSLGTWALIFPSVKRSHPAYPESTRSLHTGSPSVLWKGPGSPFLCAPPSPAVTWQGAERQQVCSESLMAIPGKAIRRD